MMEIALVPPSQVTHLKGHATSPTSIALTWKAPIKGTKPFSYTVFIRERSAVTWGIGATALAATSAEIKSLKPATTYQLEVMARNA